MRRMFFHVSASLFCLCTALACGVARVGSDSAGDASQDGTQGPGSLVHTQPIELCDNRIDDDGDGLIDCADPNCNGQVGGPRGQHCEYGQEKTCDDDFDNNGNHRIDCDDGQCGGTSVCTTAPQEICDNKIDDDGDGFVDCGDPDCFGSPACVASGVRIEGELIQFRKVEVSFDGPAACEDDAKTNGNQNPFLDYRFDVTFAGPGGLVMTVPGFFNADGNPAEAGAIGPGGLCGTVYTARLSPPLAGHYTVTASFCEGSGVAVNSNAPCAKTAFNGASASFNIDPPPNDGDPRNQGRPVKAANSHYMRYTKSGRYFVQNGPDSPENMLAYFEFDNTVGSDKYAKYKTGLVAGEWLHRYKAHAVDFDDPSLPGGALCRTWQNGKGKNFIGKLRYLASVGANQISGLTYGIGGDGNDVNPYRGIPSKWDMATFRHFDTVKLQQWEEIFSCADSLGITLHFKLSEYENNDHWNDGELGQERRLYYREFVARFAHHPVVFNLGEEYKVANPVPKLIAYSKYIKSIDPYDNVVVVHTLDDEIRPDDLIRNSILMHEKDFDGGSLQLYPKAHRPDFIGMMEESRAVNNPYYATNDEQGGPGTGVQATGTIPAPGPGNPYPTLKSRLDLSHLNILNHLVINGLTANLSGGAWFYGVNLPNGDLDCEDQKSRDVWFRVIKNVRAFFETGLPLDSMRPHDNLGSSHKGKHYVLAEPGRAYVVYNRDGQQAQVNLAPGTYTLEYFNHFTGLWHDKQTVTGGNLVLDFPAHTTDPSVAGAPEMKPELVRIVK